MRKVLICLIFTFYNLLSFADTDAGMYFCLSADKKFGKNFSLSLSDEIDVNENFSFVSKNFVSIGGEYKISKKMSCSIFYRNIQKHELEGLWSYQHRYYANWACETKMSDWKLSYRLRYQVQHKDFGKSDDWNILQQAIRNKFAITKMMLGTPFKMQLAAEPYITVWEEDNNPYLSKMKIEYTFNYALTGYQSIAISCLWQKEFNCKNPDNTIMLGITYSIRPKF